MRIVALVVAAAFVAGCGAEDPDEPAAPQPPAATTQPADPPPTATTPSGTTVLAIYFLGDGRVQPVRRETQSTPAVARAALEALFAGPTADERQRGLDSDVAPGIAVRRLAVAGGVATVDLEPCPPMAQVVYTLTRFPTVEAVAGSCSDGRRLARADFEDETPAILVESPLAGEPVESPLRITGTANTFEANFQVEIVDWDGRIVEEGFVTATSGSGTRGTFDASFPFEVDRPGGALIVFEESAEDGSRINLVEIPLQLQPRSG